jgi:hypothetical protein
MRRDDEYRIYIALVFLVAAVILTAADAAGWVIVTALVSATAIGLVALVRTARTAKVLVVGPKRTAADDLVIEALDRAGYRTCHCVGPTVRACPFDAGLPCPIEHQLAAITIVHDPASEVPVPRCEEALRLPTVVVDATDEGFGAFERSLRR